MQITTTGYLDTGDTTLTSNGFDTTDHYSSVTFTCYDNYTYNKEDEYWINYWHAIELRSYWHQPKEIGKPFKPQIKPLMGFARSKLRKHKLKPELCLN